MPTIQYPIKGDCAFINSGMVELNQNCNGDSSGRGWVVSLCKGKFTTSNNDFPSDASHIKVPAGLRATIYTNNDRSDGQSKVIDQNQEYDFCSDRGWADKKITKIEVELLSEKQDHQNYIDSISTRFDEQVRMFNDVYMGVELLGHNGINNISQKYKRNLIHNYKKIYDENKENKEEYIINRRRFLDANPHESVQGIGPFKTLDDRLIILFWISFTIFIIPSSLFLAEVMGYSTYNNKYNYIVVMFIIKIISFGADYILRYKI
jgi:hypothetical protein